jgi:rare lipoprotein A
MIDPWPNHTVWPALSVALVLTARLTTGTAVKPPKPTTSSLYTLIGRLVHRELDKHVTIVRTPAEMLACLATYSPILMLRFIFPLLLLGSAPVQAAALSCGHASFYGTASDGYAWQTMANGRPMNPAAMTTAHRFLPFGARLRVTNLSSRKSVVVTVTDRGPFVHGRVLDLSHGAFSRIASPSQGVAKVCFAKL